jgi:hypothetical protein
MTWDHGGKEGKAGLRMSQTEPPTVDLGCHHALLLCVPI